MRLVSQSKTADLAVQPGCLLAVYTLIKASATLLRRLRILCQMLLFRAGFEGCCVMQTAQAPVLVPTPSTSGQPAAFAPATNDQEQAPEACLASNRPSTSAADEPSTHHVSGASASSTAPVAVQQVQVPCY